MKHSGIALMMANKALAMPQVQQQWAIHMQTFGPLLGESYRDDPVARVHIINILNKISRADMQGARDTMATLRKACGCEGAPQQALWHFLLGLMADMQGNAEAMVQAYESCNAQGHRFYLPHLKLARYRQHQMDRRAIGHYRDALACLGDDAPAKSRAVLLRELSHCYADFGMPAEAAKAMEQAAALHPEVAAAIRQITIKEPAEG